MERITREHCETALKVVCRQLGVPYADKSVGYGDLPGNALVIDAYNPGDGWRGRVETIDGRSPFGEHRYSTKELYYALQAISRALEVKQQLDNGTFGDYRKGY